MTPGALINDLKRLINNPSTMSHELQNWQWECENLIRELPEDDARQLLREVQQLVNENRRLFEQESRSILETLKNPGKHPSSDRARRYKDIGNL